MNNTNGYDGPVTVTTADDTHLAAQVNPYEAKDGGGLVGAVHVPPQMENKFNDGDRVIVNTGTETGGFTVTGTVLLAGPKAGCFAQVA